MPHEIPRIGLIEDDPIMGESLQERLSLEGFDVTWWKAGEAALSDRRVKLAELGLMICDIRLPDIGGEEVFRRAAESPGAPPFLFVTAHADIDQAVRLMRAGAGDFVTKPFAMDEFLSRIASAMRPATGTSEAPHLGVSPQMRRIEETLRRLADQRLAVLLSGETGVGKEVAARFLHAVSSRAAHPFVAVNCAAIPADLLESEIFGHERGAFTGAASRHLGYAERAKDGTLFLDEIGELPLALQAKLLRLLEEGIFTRVGGETSLPLKARIVAASNADLASAVERGAFREDLFFRLNALWVELPPLRERIEDIPWLMETLFPADQAMSRGIRGIGSLAEEAALAHPWPGNVRELRNRLQRAAALADGEWIMPRDLFPELGMPAPEDMFPTLAEVRDAAERRQIERALEVTEGQISETSRILGISRTTLWEKMRRLGIPGRD
ncbi:sigma-54 dependent transcriptional regulator [Afifella sp. IM 167]|uniref:sigma-54-dependent transcriptional regulator n=1 Tax=Afifella sp. IM 167 TaxID=2033586 RepID=UPI001CCD964D|nr:sigma-54 dependent transcriptional regulator [Afifella sp. IM 167]MBZ8134423.1 sigma-54-dependent Fis family transcriptional regulator [Afifella sp. IM 167]